MRAVFPVFSLALLLSCAAAFADPPCRRGEPDCCEVDADCDDGDACNGVESCNLANGTCVGGPDVGLGVTADGSLAVDGGRVVVEQATFTNGPSSVVLRGALDRISPATATGWAHGVIDAAVVGSLSPGTAVAGRVEVWGDGPWAIREIRYCTPRRAEFYKFRERWDFKDVTDKELAAVEKRVADEFYEEIVK